MKTARLLASLILCSAPLLAAETEGVATFKMTMKSSDRPGPEGTTRISFSRSAVRIESQMSLPAGPGETGHPASPPATYDTTMIEKLAEPDKIYMVNDRSKTYAIMDVPKPPADARTDDTWTVKRQGRGSVAGVSCVNALITSSKGSEVEACVATDLFGSSAWWSAMNRRSGSDNWLKAMNASGLKGLPVRMKMRMGKDKAAGVEMELVRYDRGAVPASQFEVPAGYKQTTPTSVNLTPDGQKMMSDAMAHMTPEQRKAYEEAIKKAQQRNQ